MRSQNTLDTVGWFAVAIVRDPIVIAICDRDRFELPALTWKHTGQISCVLLSELVFLSSWLMSELSHFFLLFVCCSGYNLSLPMNKLRVG